MIAIVVNVISFINEIAFAKDDLAIKALLYLIFQIVTLSVILIVFGRYCAECRQEVQSVENERARMLVASGIDSAKGGRTIGGPTLLATLWIILPFFFQMVLVYTVTLGVFPGYMIDLGLKWDSPAAVQLILLTYNVGDLVGKWFYTWKQVPDNLFPHILGLSRIFYPLFICIIFGSMQLTSLKDKPWITLLYTSTMAISN